MNTPPPKVLPEMVVFVRVKVPELDMPPTPAVRNRPLPVIPRDGAVGKGQDAGGVEHAANTPGIPRDGAVRESQGAAEVAIPPTSPTPPLIVISCSVRSPPAATARMPNSGALGSRVMVLPWPAMVILEVTSGRPVGL